MEHYKRTLWRAAAVVFMCLGMGVGAFSGGQPPVKATGGGDITGSLIVDGRERTFLIHLPDHSEPESAAPLVLVLHGGGGSADNTTRVTHFSEIADREGFVAVYPNGTGERHDDRLLSWNAGNCCAAALENQVDDVAFFSALIDYMIAEYNVDPARVYATGLSNGAMMSYRIACELSDKVTAIAPVEGALNTACEPTDPVSILIIHGTADQYVRYEGGIPLKGVDPKHPREDTSVAFAVDFWVAHNQCDATPATVTEDELITDVYRDCTQGTAVEVITIIGGEHAWPGGEASYRAGDEPSDALDASEVIWAFFADKTR